MNRTAAKILIALVVLAVAVYFLPTPSAPEPNRPTSGSIKAENAATNSVAVAPQVAVAPTPAPPVSAAPVVPPPNAAAAGVVESTPNSDISSIPTAIAVQNVSHAIRQYGGMFNGNPVGTNPEITAALSGKNPRQINFINGDAGMRVNAQGEMIDPWGTPYFFHQISGTEMEIHSAGPDRVMWTSDDVVSK